MIPLRDENPTRTFPFVTIALIAVNAVVFVYEIVLPPPVLEGLFQSFALIPDNLVHHGLETGSAGLPNILTLLSSTFLHGSLLHIISNMLFLWIFGNNIEDAFGHFTFIIFYFVSAVAAGLTQALMNSSSTVPVIGASGAVAGVLGAYILLYPQARVITLFWVLFFIKIIRVPAVIFLGIWFLLQIMYAGVVGGSIAWYAHIGGFMAGLVMAVPLLFTKRR